MARNPGSMVPTLSARPHAIGLRREEDLDVRGFGEKWAPPISFERRLHDGLERGRTVLEVCDW